jgi:hypothetical protein
MALFLLTHTDESRSQAVLTRASEKAVLARKVAPCSVALVSKTIVTPKDMYETLAIQDGEFGSLVIVRFESYWGYHDADLWTWLQGHGENL